MEFLLKLWLILIGIVTIIFTSYTIIYFYYSKKPTNKFNKTYFPEVTLIIPFYNEEVILKKKIENTSKIKYPKGKLKVLFLNDHSNDRSIQIIKDNTKNFPFNFKIANNEKEQGKPNALNYIFPKIKTEITIITDADSLIKEDAIGILVQDFQSKGVGGVTAKLNILKPKGSKNTYNEEKTYRIFYDVWRKGESNLDSVSVCNGPLMAFRTKLIRGIKLSSTVDDTELVFEV